ncbi:hypothetical protein [Halobacillus sp. B23F22_1]|uniref:hypothetical protein n=1 Tax=Halobacillus sp. B23F22_1 TaxID=3459514 RepID=UPI00373E7576
MMDSLLMKLVATFGMTTATAGKISALIIAAYNAGTLTLRGAAVLIAGTGVVGIGVALVALISYPFLVKKIKAGKAAVTAW